MGQGVITLNNPQPGLILSPVNLPAASANAPPVPSWVYLAGLLPDRSNMGQAVITLNNPQPGFILSPVNLPAAQQTLTGYLDAIVGINLSGGFSGDIKFTFSGLPAGVIGSFSGPLECGGPTCRLVFFELVAGVTRSEEHK